jgi:hypothetical protein
VETTSSTSIAEIKDAIKACEERIQSLNNQLKEAKEEQRRWERQLTITARGLDHINKYPIEILTEIFQTYLTFNHRHIRRLLLVCKKWYKVVKNAPSLWNRIDVFFPEASAGQSFDLIPYVQACKGRSENLKLEVTLDLGNFADPEDYHTSVLWSLVHGECSECLIEGLSPNYTYQFECAMYEQRKEEAIDTVRVLVGEDSKDMARWSSFDLNIPYMDEAIKEIAPALLLLNGPTNSLHSISIYSLDRWFNISYDDDMFNRFPGITDCSRVERLKLRGTAIGSIPIQYSSIRHLDIMINYPDELLDISSMKSLETLDITIMRRHNSDVDLPGQGNVRSSFPCLYSMQIAGYFDNNWLEALNFDAPSLRMFSVSLWEWNRLSSDSFAMKFPNISPRIVTFIAGDVRMVPSSPIRYWNNEEFEKALFQVLHHFSRAERIVFRLSTDEILNKVLLDRTKRQQRCPTVYIERKGDLFRLHHAETIESP